MVDENVLVYKLKMDKFMNTIQKSNKIKQHHVQLEDNLTKDE